MPSILVVDDSAVDRRLVGKLLMEGTQIHVDMVGNGTEALAWIEHDMPDLVVTDLQMPSMDGLELVTTLRSLHPALPVVLITAHGSEDLAIAALERGAASYVPKSQLIEKLLDTVQDVLQRTNADHNFEQLSRTMKRAEFGFELENQDTLVESLAELVRQILVNIQTCDSTEEMRVGMALEEALHRAIFCGNLELTSHQASQARAGCEEGYQLALERRWQAPYSNRRVFFDVSIRPSEARFTVRHEGPAIDSSNGEQLAQMLSSADQSDRGRVLIQTFMDEVTFEQEGREIVMVKRALAADRICSAS
jgi:CheY-like chemotaxis protein